MDIYIKNKEGQFERYQGISVQPYNDAEIRELINGKQPKGDYATKGELPTSLSELSQDATHRVVSDTEKTNWNDKASKIDVVNGASGAVKLTMQPNKLYRLGACTKITITLAKEIAGIYNEYMLQFTSNGVTTIGLPSGVKWSENSDPTKIVTQNIYQISIMGNLATLIGGKK